MSGHVIYDLKKFMPAYGENRLSVSYTGCKLTVEVRFDGKVGTEESKLISFGGVSFYSVGAFPGVQSIAGKYECDFITGSVIEAENSNLSAQWVEYWQKSGFQRHCSHFIMFWDSENKVIHVIAESVELS